jgi:hypothetical protein
MAKISDSPEFIICLSCETPCYTFEWVEGDIKEAFCQACGNDEADQFATEEDLEAMAGHWLDGGGGKHGATNTGAAPKKH